MPYSGASSGYRVYIIFIKRNGIFIILFLINLPTTNRFLSVYYFLAGSLQPSSPPDTSTLTLSAPASSITVSSINESLIEQNELIVESQAEINRPPKKVNHGKAQKQENLSPKSALSLRRSPRFKVSCAEIFLSSYAFFLFVHAMI